MNPPAADPIKDQLRSIAPPVHYVDAIDLFWLVVALAALLAVAAALIWWFYFRKRPRKPPVPPLSPRQIAAARLQQILARMDEMTARDFGNEVCDILRVFIGAQYGLHPERQTSPEFLESVTRSHAFSRHEHALLTDFLDGCDLLKFARLDATRDAKERLVQEAVEFIEGSAARTPPPLPAAAC